MADGTCEPASRPTEDTCSSNVVTRDVAGDGRAGAGGAGAGAGAGADATPGSAPKPAMPVFPYKDAEQSVEVRPHERPGRRIRVVSIRREGGAGTVFFGTPSPCAGCGTLSSWGWLCVLPVVVAAWCLQVFVQVSAQE